MLPYTVEFTNEDKESIKQFFDEFHVAFPDMSPLYLTPLFLIIDIKTWKFPESFHEGIVAPQVEFIEQNETLKRVLQELQKKSENTMNKTIVNNEGEWSPWWHKMDWEDTSLLDDHYFYLVTIPYFQTPMKAKWHNDICHWEIFGVPTGIPGQCRCMYVDEWETDSDMRVIAWMHLPEVYKGETIA